MRVLLPWPPPVLSPNARAHWAKRARSARRYRATAQMLTRNVLPSATLPAADTIHVGLVFRPIDRRSRDLDNCIASLKAGLDGIADALGVNDARFRLSAEIGPPSRPAVVEVTIGEPQ